MDKLALLCDELIGTESLINLLENNVQVKHYIGFEISGKVHLGTGLITMQVIKSLQEMGVECQIYLANWHAAINDKLGGDIDFINTVGIPYFKKSMEEAAKICGVDLEKLKFINGDELYNGSKYWALMLDVAKNTNLARVQRSIDVLGRSEADSVDFAKLIYPIMQAADIFMLNCHIAHGGTDQRKAHVIALDAYKSLKDTWAMNEKDERTKPICIHQHLLIGLGTPSEKFTNAEEITYEMRAELKMSKSKPNTAVFLDDSEEDVLKKIKAAYCKEGDVKLNPVLEWAKLLCFNLGNKTLEVVRKPEWGGNVLYTTYSDLELDFANKKLHPSDLKDAVARSLNFILTPARLALGTDEIRELKQLIDKKVSR